jgi:hypothetical protein
MNIIKLWRVALFLAGVASIVVGLSWGLAGLIRLLWNSRYH